MSFNITSPLPDGSYDRIAEKTGKSKGLVGQYFGESTVARMGPKTEVAILEEAELIIKEVLQYLRQRKKTAQKKLQKKQKIAA